MKHCPLCAEEIQDAAIVCRSCGRDLPADGEAPVLGPQGRTRLEDAHGGPPWILVGVLGVLCVVVLIVVVIMTRPPANAGAGAAPMAAGAAPVASPLPDPGTWDVSTEPSAAGGTNAYALLGSNETVQGDAGPTRPTLALRCVEGLTDVYIAWNLPLGQEAIGIRTGLENGAVADELWSLSVDGRTAFYEGDAIALIHLWTGHHRLQADVTPAGSARVSVSFNLSGLAEAVTPIRSACSWP
jgi:type VI secretion system VasI family protein